MGKKPLSVVALELGVDHLGFVEMSRAERRILTSGVYSLAPGRSRDADHLAAQIRSALGTAEGAPEAVIASVPLGEAWLRVLDLPDDAGDEAAARDQAEWDMSRYLGCPREVLTEDLVVDVIPAPGGRGPGETSAARVVAAAFPRAQALALRTTVERASGLRLAALDVDAAAVVNVFHVNYPERVADRTLLILANASATALIRVQHGACQGVVLRPEEPVPAPSSEGASPVPGARTQEDLRRVLGVVESLQAAPDGWEAPAHVLVCGERARDAGFRELLRAHLPVPFSLLNPFLNAITGPDPTVHPESYPGAAMAVPVGLAWRLAEDLS